MLDALSAVYAYVSRRYANCVGALLKTAKYDEVVGPDSPIWQWQNAAMRPAVDESTTTGAVILDADIGLCLYLQTFTTRSDLRSQLSRALAVRSELMPRRLTDQSDVDSQGEWSVAVLWLCEPDAFDRWVNQIAELRSETAHFEEVPADVLVNVNGDWMAACERHGLPKLLLETRGALRRSRFDDTVHWINADPIIRGRVKAALAGAPPADAPMARETLKELDKIDGPGGLSNASPSHPSPLYEISVRQFRNIDNFGLHLRGRHDGVSANIIHGPNGSGKSALAEALSIAMGGVSERYLDFLNDANEPNLEKSAKYVSKYLTPLDGPLNAEPKVGINGAAPIALVLVNDKLASEQCANLSGTILSQSRAENLTRLRAEELGAQIAGNFSKLAASLIEFVEARSNGAEGERAAFNREWGLRANVSRDDTAKVRIASIVLDNLLPLPKADQSWLAVGAGLKWRYQATFSEALDQWRVWDSGAAGRARTLARSVSREEILANLRAQLASHNSLLSTNLRLAQLIENVVRTTGEAPENFEQEISIWAKWLRRTSSDRAPDQAVLQESRSKVADLQRRLERHAQLGASMRERLAHIETVSAYVQQHWLEEHPDTCPICASDVADRGGIAKALALVRADLEADIQGKRIEYVGVKQELDAAESRLAQLDSETAPLSIERQSNLQSAIRQLFDTSFDLLSLASEPIELDAIELMRFAMRPYSPTLSPREDDELLRLSSEGTKRTSSAFERFSAVSEAPERWKNVRRIVVSELAAAIEEHLPQTIQALWWELARNMMPAAWQYPGPVVFTVDRKRSQTEARLIVKGRSRTALAAHILNSAELHNLGVAWFFARYLTHGRYFHSSVVLDDPAGQMDQPSFRDFCRFLEALVRLHRRESLPLTLVLFLHQDDRALQAARATDGVLHFLRWNHGTTSIMTHWKMRTSPISTHRPYKIIQSR